MKVLRLLLFPFSLLYGVIVYLRNLAYDKGVFSSRKFDLPVISIGNLAVGGAGKSPMTEYLISLLKEKYSVGTLSRGYGRKTKGYYLVETTSLAEEVGDEPLQFKNKFPGVTVAVCEDRIYGIEKLRKDHDLIIMDDAYQHRAVKPGYSILLFDYNKVFRWQWYLPTGDLRESMTGRKRADIIVVSKAPDNLTESAKQKVLKRIKPFKGQETFFSSISYDKLILADQSETRLLSTLNADTQIVVLTGIAYPQPLLDELKRHSPQLIHHEYADHHLYTRKNITKLAQAFIGLKGADKLIITTEKDMQRLRGAEEFELLASFPVYYLPISVKIVGNEDRFNSLIQKYVTGNLYNNRIH
jgi:tetraacyldisaccharide 4'-kinase